jgi:predicted NAD/FAD-binding protein
MDDLQSLSTDKRSHLFTALNVLSPPDSAHILGRYAYSHPVFSSDAVHAQHALAQLNARIMESGWHRAFAGAWACYGFHKDSFALPFAITDADVEQASWASSARWRTCLTCSTPCGLAPLFWLEEFCSAS